MSDLNIRFSNCFNFINNTKQYLEANPTDWRNIYTMEDLIRAECDLMEMELEAAHDAKEYDSIMNGNIFRKGRNRKARHNGKRNTEKAKRLHKADRYHGKHVEPFLYKENGVIKESIEDVWRNCRNPVSDRVHYHSALKANAREQDFLCNPSVSEMKIEQEEKQMEELDERILDNHYALENVLTTLKKGKYISLFSYWNGEYWKDSSAETNKFCGIKTAEEVKDKVLTEQARRIHLPEIEMETVHGMEGVSFKWNSFYDWDDEEYGYRKLTFLPLN